MEKTLNVDWYFSDYARQYKRLIGNTKGIIKQGDKLAKTHHLLVVTALGDYIKWNEYKTKYLERGKNDYN